MGSRTATSISQIPAACSDDERSENVCTARRCASGSCAMPPTPQPLQPAAQVNKAITLMPALYAAYEARIGQFHTGLHYITHTSQLRLASGRSGVSFRGVIFGSRHTLMDLDDVNK